MRKGMRYNYHKQFRKILKKANRMIANDPLFLGRFEVLNIGERWWGFEDNSGGELTVFLRVYDKANGYYRDYGLEYAPWMTTFYWHLNMDILNDFIVERSSFWHEEPTHTIHNAKDYRNVRVPSEYYNRKQKDWNFYEDCGLG